MQHHHRNMRSLRMPSTLNTDQQQAVNIVEGPTLVLAGAGSGKTRIVTFRIAKLIEAGVDPSNILGVTFTNKAAEEMRERVQKLTQSHVLICTFHSLGARILRESISHLGYQRDFTIYDEDDAYKVIKSCLAELSIEDKKGEVKAYKNRISAAKNAMILPDQLSPNNNIDRDFSQVYTLYQQKLQQYNAVDFDDLLLLTVRLWKEHPDVLAHYQQRWTYVLIDEYQDVNEAQYKMARLLVGERLNLFVVGDPDQSIYSWRGADVNNILNFERDYPGAKVIRLEQNYRSRSNILKAANSLIEHNYNRYEKNLWSDLGPGEKLKLYMGKDERAEAEFVASVATYHGNQHHIPLNEMAVFYRTHAQSRALEDTLAARRIPYVLIGGLSFYQRREIKDILAFLRMIPSGSDFVSFMRTLNIPKRGIGESTMEKIQAAANLERFTLFAYCDALISDIPLQNPIKLTAKQRSGIKEYVQIINELRHLSKEGSLHELVIAAIEKTGYMKYIKEDEETYQERKENLGALIAKAAEWETTTSEPSLDAFLEELSLKSALDESNPTDERLRLMSIHHGKGLEFTVAFLVGLEEQLFPYILSKDDQNKLEEERRLCYVGITRAKEYLYLSYCSSRFLWGTKRQQWPSRFLKEISPEFLERFNTARLSISRTEESEKPPIPQGEFSEGETVFHPQFGIGQIRQLYDTDQGLAYKVMFTKDHHERILLAQFAPLSRL